MEGCFAYGNISVHYIVPENAESVCYFHGTKAMADKLASSPPGNRVGLLAITGEGWNRDLSPWAAPAVFQKGGDFSGGAARHLSFLREKVIPVTEEKLGLHVTRRGLMGYSLAGLFALYAMYQTNLFTDIASVSGSLWYDGFVEYMRGEELKCRPEKVESCTAEAKEYLCSIGINCVFEKNPGNHFYQETERMQKAFRWLFGK